MHLQRLYNYKASIPKSCVGQVNSLEGVWCRSLTPVPTTRTSLRRVASRCERLRRLRRLRAVAAGCEPLRAIASHCSHCEPLRAIASGWSGRGRLQTALHTRPGCALVLCDDWTPMSRCAQTGHWPVECMHAHTCHTCVCMCMWSITQSV